MWSLLQYYLFTERTQYSVLTPQSILDFTDSTQSSQFYFYSQLAWLPWQGNITTNILIKRISVFYRFFKVIPAEDKKSWKCEMC